MYFVYVLRCVDSSLYCGYTTDVVHRIKAHSGEIKGGARYTRIRPPLRVEAVWRCSGKSAALGLEKLIKNLEMRDKERIIAGDLSLADMFGEKLETSLIERAAEFEGEIGKTDGSGRPI